jgi:predicted Zn-dependent protease with MMP-like domain
MSTPVNWSAALAPSLDDLDALAREMWTQMPEQIRQAVGPVVIRVEDFASQDVLDELGIEDPFELTGLYQGVDLTQRSVLDPAPEPAIVFLYREPILDEWVMRGDVTLGEMVAHVLVHEIGHHFGISDEDIDKLLDEEE